MVIKASAPEGKRGTSFMQKCLERGGERDENKEGYMEYSWRWVKVRREGVVFVKDHVEVSREELLGPVDQS